MISKFLNLEAEKQDRILNAAMKEFTQKGYDNASTNGIVKEAKISKGLLFHYFKNKKDLFLFLYDHSTEKLINDFYQELDLSERDIFERLKKIMILKSQMLNRYPEIFNFLMAAYLEGSPDVKNDLDHNKAQFLQENAAKIFDQMDTSKFKDGVDIQRAIHTILWTLEGFSNQVMQKVKYSGGLQYDFSADFDEADVYINILKETFYK
ncbi:TetR/AcrR family transcriptional regulator [Cytobacillus spongiae]|jgi:AcrR family transcriptional regulator|uniref:TetR/AcrR family transcriptional regulator n=1 Tax=Cytobacillus spongiae TaxID=2901381 RepID=UPI001F30F13D|nr:TetR/AcrR family transcriptional regulator [Cytobacillus spongiae]UII56293.1 TetR/AcrR family transcriptional regulator [Cytobacillus spongiae]